MGLTRNPVDQKSRGFAGNIGNIRRAREILDYQIFTGNLSYVFHSHEVTTLFVLIFHKNVNFGTNFAQIELLRENVRICPREN